MTFTVHSMETGSIRWHFIQLSVILYLTGAVGSSAINVTFVSLMPYSSLALSYDYYGPVTDMAIEKLNTMYPRFHFDKINFIGSAVKTCNDLEDIVANDLYQYLRNKSLQRTRDNMPAGITVLTSTGCSTALRWIGDLAREANLPLIASGGSSAYLNNPSRFPTMLRLLVYQQGTVSLVLRQFLRRFNWTTISLICDDNPGLGDFIALACSGFFKTISGEADTDIEDFHFDSARTPVVDYEAYLMKASRKSRIIVICAHANRTRDIMVAAHRKGMTNGNFVYITAIPTEHPLYGYYQWQFNDGRDDEAQEAFKSLYFISTQVMRGDGYSAFEMEVKYRAFLDYKFYYAAKERVSPFSALQHTIVMLTGKLINETAQKWDEISEHNGKGMEIMRHAFERRLVSSVTGDFILDHGDRELYVYVVTTMDHETYNFKEVFTYDTLSNHLVPSTVNNITWAYRDSPPPNKPECGFEYIDNSCHVSRQELIAIYCGVALAAVVLGGGLFWFARRTKKTADGEENTHWHIPFHDIVMDNPGGQSTSNGNGYLGSMLFKRNEEKRSRAPLVAMVSVHSTHNLKSTILYRGKRFWLHKVALSTKFSPKPLEEKLIFKMKSTTSNSLLKFYGFCPMDTVMGVVCEVAPRGSLATVMREQKIRFDALIKNSVIADLTNALSYLHTSSIEHHGALSRANCLLDNRLVLKVAYFRLDILPRPQPDFTRRTSANNAFITYAPEQLRHPTSVYQGSREADMYSYGHVMAEVLCEIEPFQTEIEIADYSAEEIIEMVRREGKTPFRPKIPLYNILPKLSELIDRCWEEKPASRPTIQQIAHQLKTVAGFEREYNLVEELLKRLNAHADALEVRIQSATHGAMEEKKRAEELLLQVLPKHVVSALKKGIRVDPEGFNSTTVGFTALENFGVIVATSTPLQIVALLNDLYSMFDATLPRFDVYKVETISDSYMIASGVPVRNGQQHSKEIAGVALELMKEAETFQSKEVPDSKNKDFVGYKNGLLMKIGIHTGSCVAGVIGQRNPRYCLFGDTINMASRMTSFGQAMKIQVSAEGREHLIRNWGKFRFQFRGVIDIKGKGPQPCYWLLGEPGPEESTQQQTERESSSGSEMLPENLHPATEAGDMKFLPLSATKRRLSELSLPSVQKFFSPRTSLVAEAQPNGHH